MDELEILAMEAKDACQRVMRKNLHLVPMLAYRCGKEELRYLPLPYTLLKMLNSPATKPIVFDAIALMLAANDADLAIWMAEAWMGEVNPHTVASMSRPDLEKLCAKGVPWMAEQGFCTRREVLSVVAQTPERVVHVIAPFVRYQKMVRFEATQVKYMLQSEVPDNYNIKLFREVKV